MKIAFVGAGRVGRALSQALRAEGEEVVAVAGRADAAAAVAAAELVFLTVPDDAIAPACAALPWRAGQAVVHCSGATELDALAAAREAGAAVGGFHPLQIFSDPARAVALLAGSVVGIEAPDAALAAELHRLAAVLGMRPLALQPGMRATYHAAASYSASFLLSMLDESARLWGTLGLPQDAALAALLPLARGTLDAAAARGLAGALSGPISRGDAGVVARHLSALEALPDPAHGRFYRELARRQLALARAAGRLDEAALQALAAALSEKG